MTTEDALIVEITAEQTRPIRQQVLRPHQDARELVYPGDDSPDSFHLGVVQCSNLVAVLSMYREPMPGEVDCVWRIRGMASVPGFRGVGFGRKLVDTARDRAWNIERVAIWCNARESAFGFYEKLGFVAVGELFEIEGIGTHSVMVLEPN